jgi:hypothetical protein
MKTIEQLTNIDKAKIIFDLFKEEIPEFLNYLQGMAEKIAHDEDELIANWSNPFLSYHQWLNLSKQVSATVKRYGKNLEKSDNTFAEQLFGGYAAIFSNHCLEKYGNHKSKSPRFPQAMALFYTPLKPVGQQSYEYLELEMHGGAEFAAICTDEDGENLIFSNRRDAEEEASNCQDGLVVEI